MDREVEESQGLCKVRTIAQLICSRISGSCALIGSLFSLAVWRVSAEGQVSLLVLQQLPGSLASGPEAA